MMPPPGARPDPGRRVRSLAYWGAGVGATLVLLLAFVGISTYTFIQYGDELSGPSDGSMFHGGEVFGAWLVSNLVAGLGMLVFGVAALVLDIVLLTTLSGLRGRGARAEVTRPVQRAVVTVLVAIPAIMVLMFLPSMVFGPGEVTNAVLIVLLAAMVVAPLSARIAQVVLARRLVDALTSGRAWAPVEQNPRGR